MQAGLKYTRKDKIKRKATSILLAVFWCFASLAEADERLSLSNDTAFLSRYVWRGMLLSDCWVFQPSVALDYKRLFISVWGNMDLGETNDKDFCFSELDYMLNYFFTADCCSFSLGGVRYTYPNTLDRATTEIYLNLEADLLLNPVITVYKDVDEAKGTYVSLGLGHSLPVKRWNSSLVLAFSVGIGTDNHNRYYYEVGKDALLDLLLNVLMHFEIREGTRISPGFSYTKILDNDIRSFLDKKDNIIFGLTFSTAF